MSPLYEQTVRDPAWISRSCLSSIEVIFLSCASSIDVVRLSCACKSSRMRRSIDVVLLSCACN